MNIRIKFEKYGPMRFLGHLDLMRYFQKALRRAEFPLEFSKGFHPHPIMSFAQPLSVGVTSQGEYFDVKLAQNEDVLFLTKKLSECVNDGIEISKIVELPEKSKNAMSLVAAAKYIAYFKSESNFDIDSIDNKINTFLSQSEIIYTKQTKKNEITTDIKPFIYELNTSEIKDNKYGLPEGNCFNLFLKAGSEFNLTSNAVLDLLFDEKYQYGIHRVDLYCKKDDLLVPMIS